jgi:hypothetical protein
MYETNLLILIFNKEEFKRNINLVLGYARKSKILIFYAAIEMLPLKYESSTRLYTYTKPFASFQRSIPSSPEKEICLLQSIEMKVI